MKILDIMPKIRDLVNKYPLEESLQSNARAWNEICAGMDTIEDTQEAISLYLSLPNFKGFSGEYLYLYGLFQSLYVQQDSVCSLYKLFLGKDIYLEKEYPRLYKVREYRDDIFGHPVNRKNHRSHVISRPMISKDSIQVLDYFSDKPHTFRTISIQKCIEIQHHDILTILKIIQKQLDKMQKDLSSKSI